MKLYYTPGACSLADHIALEWTGKPYVAQRMSREARYAERGDPELHRRPVPRIETRR